MVYGKVFYIFAIIFLLVTYSESAEFSECERIHLPNCGKVFVSAWKNADDNMNTEQKLALYCNAFQSYGKCLSENSRTCSGTIIGLLRQGIADHLLVNKKTNLCPNMDFSAIVAKLEDLAKVNIPADIAKLFDLKDLDSYVAEDCDITASRDCASNIAGKFINHFKANACLASEANYVFTCFESNVNQCNGKLSADFSNTLKKIGKLIMDEQKPLLDNC